VILQKQQDRQLTFKRNISSKYCCSGKAISITYFECVSVALGIQHAKRMRHIVICGFSGSTKFIHIISLKGMVCPSPPPPQKSIHHEMCVLIFYTTFD
jgi:hypothetical protein